MISYDKRVAVFAVQNVFGKTLPLLWPALGLPCPALVLASLCKLTYDNLSQEKKEKMRKRRKGEKEKKRKGEKLCYDSDIKADVEKVVTRSRATSRQKKVGRSSGSAINHLLAHPVKERLTLRRPHRPQGPVGTHNYAHLSAASLRGVRASRHSAEFAIYTSLHIETRKVFATWRAAASSRHPSECLTNLLCLIQQHHAATVFLHHNGLVTFRSFRPPASAMAHATPSTRPYTTQSRRELPPNRLSRTPPASSANWLKFRTQNCSSISKPPMQ